MFVDPFSKKVKEFATRFDFATINKDTAELRKLLKEAETALDGENSASQAMLYYSLGTAYEDIAEITGDRSEKSIKKVLYYFRESIKLIEKDKNADKKYSSYVFDLIERLYTNYANVLDRCGRKIVAIEQYKKVLSLHSNFGMALGYLGRVYQHYGMLEYDDNIEEYGDGLALYISESELYDTTFELLKILREVIINLYLCVNIAEQPKREASKDKFILPISLMDYEDDWKI